MAKHIEVPEIWYPNQRVIRSVIQGVISSIPTIIAIIGIVNDTWPAEWLAATLTLGLAIQGALARIMSLPGVNDWLTKIGAGSIPKSEVDQVVREANADLQAKISREGLF